MYPSIPDLPVEAMRLTRQIPRGRVATYGDIATALGDPLASRYIGQLMLDHAHTAACCCHRIVRADGALGHYISGDPRKKAALLRQERIDVQSGRVSLPRLRWSDFECDAPLQRLVAFQHQVAAGFREEANLDFPATAMAVDVSFVPKSMLAVAAFAEVDLVRRELIYYKTSLNPVRFPYISTYLAFRELPLLQTLLAEVRAERRLDGIVFVDGSGILHPRRAGIATMLGVTEGLVTIGVTKKHLAGRVDLSDMRQDSAREIYLEDRLSGFAVLPGSGTKQPLYVSPGQAIDAKAALAHLRRTLLGRRLPEPIYWADRLSRMAARNVAQDVS